MYTELCVKSLKYDKSPLLYSRLILYKCEKYEGELM
jgi:hypothetical protein